MTLEWVSPTRLLTIGFDGVTLRWLDAEGGAGDQQGTTITLRTRCYFARWVASQGRLLCTQGEGVFLDPKTGATHPMRARNPDGSAGSAVVTGQGFRIETAVMSYTSASTATFARRLTIARTT